MASLRLFPNQRWWMRAWKRKKTRQLQRSWWHDNSEERQIILNALSVVSMATYRGQPRRDHAPSTRSNRQRLPLWLQHNGGHGGGGPLPWKHNKSNKWRHRQLQFRPITVSRTRGMTGNGFYGAPVNKSESERERRGANFGESHLVLSISYQILVYY